jgi:dihydrolipoamide dehydrogenase
MDASSYDVVVIGGGPGGYAAAIRLQQLGLKTAVVERESMGGVCLNWGCIPSKALITAAKQWERLHESGSMGISVGAATLDFSRTQAWKAGIVNKLTRGVEGLVRSNGADVVFGAARLLDSRTVEVAASSGQRRRLRAERGVVLATGARPIELPGFRPDGARVLTAREAVSLEQVPERLLVIGGGVIGVELGTMYRKLGSEVTIVELSGGLLPGLDRDLVRVVEARLKKAGVRILLNARAAGWAERDGEAVVEVAHGGREGEIATDRVLVAVGFRPNTEELDLSAAGIALDVRGHVQVDAQYRSSAEGVYAIGDVTGGPYLAHKAYKEAEIAAEVIAGKQFRRDWLALPAVVFSDPEIAVVGLGEEEAERQGISYRVGRFPFSVLGRAMSLGETEGFVKVIAGQDRVLGVGIVGPEASELIGEAAFAIEMMAAPEDVGLTVHAHPTLSEALHEAMRHSVGEAIHVMNRKAPRSVDEQRRNVGAA